MWLLNILNIWIFFIDKKLVSQITSPVTSIQESDSFDDNIKNENKRTLPEESYNFNDYDKKKLKILEEDNVNGRILI